MLDAIHGSVVASLPSDPDVNIQQVAFSPGGERIICGGWGEESGGEVMVWNVASGRRIAWLSPRDAVFAVAISQNRQLAAIGTSEGAIQLWDIEAGVVAATLEGHECAVEALAFAHDGRSLASASHDETVRVWDAERIKPRPRLRGHADAIVDVVFSTDGQRLVTVSTNATSWIWGEQGEPIVCPYRSDSVVLMGGPPRNGVHADSARIVSLACGATWDAATGDELRAAHELDSCRFMSCEIVWEPGGRFFAAFSRARGPLALFLLDRIEKPLWRTGSDEGEVTSVAFSPEGLRLVSGSRDRTVRIWDVPTGAALGVLRGHEGEVTCVAFSPMGNRIVSAATDQTVLVWDAVGGKQLACLRIEDPGIWSRGWSSERGNWAVHAVAAVAFSADGRYVLTLSERNRVRFWDPTTSDCVRTIEGEGDFPALAAGLPCQAFLRGGALEVESFEARTVIACVPHPRSLIPRKAPISHPDGRAWAAAIGRHLYFWALSSKSGDA